MKLPCALLGALALCAPAAAQYISKGWVPGQPVQRGTAAPAASGGWDPAAPRRAPAPEPVSAPAAAAPDAAAVTPAPGVGEPGGFVDQILKSGPVASLFSAAGVNISEKLAEAHARHAAMWDMRIPLVSDANYEELIANETFASAEEERARTWFIMM
jgi:hypothetical protein